MLAWPSDPRARVALDTHLSPLTPAQPVLPALHGNFLDFRGADLSGLDLAECGLFSANLAGVSRIKADLERATLNGAKLCGKGRPRSMRHEGRGLSWRAAIRDEVSGATGRG